MKSKFLTAFLIVFTIIQGNTHSAKIFKESLFFQKGNYNTSLVAEIKSIKGNISFFNDKLVFHLGVESNENVTLHFLNSNLNPDIQFSNIDSKIQGKFKRFYQNKLEVLSTYKKLTYKNMYSNIDLVFEIDENNEFEYSYILHSGAKVSDIQFEYLGENISKSVINNSGVSTIDIKRNEKTLIHESGLKAYSNGKPLNHCSYFYGQKAIGFKLFGVQDIVEQEIIIDPVVSWSGYFGGSGTDLSTGSRVDQFGNFYISGTTTSKDYPITSGAFQTILSSSKFSDGFLTKFDSSGKLIWSTYIGGDKLDAPSKISLNENGTLIVMAGVTSSTNFPTTSGAYQTVNKGTTNGTITIFDSSGVPKYSSYFGGDKDDELICSYTKDKMYYFGGYSNSTKFPVSKNAVQKSLAGGSDAVLIILDSSFKIEYSTYFGGSSGDDRFSTIQVQNRSVYVAGNTTSSNYPVSKKAQQSKNGGKLDGVITKFYPDHSMAWSTYAGGSNDEHIRIIGFKDSSNIFTGGFTYSNNFPVTKNSLQSKFAGGNRDATVSIYDASGNQKYSTYWGGSSDDGIHGGTIDKDGNFWAGSLGSSTDLSLTNEAIMKKCSGKKDWQLFAFSPSGDTLFSSYYGGSADDICYEASADQYGNIYFGGYTSSNDFPASGSLSTSSSTGLINLAILKIDAKEILKYHSKVILTKKILCPYKDSLIATIKGVYDSVKWSTGDTTGKLTITKPGIYKYFVYGKLFDSGSFTIPISKITTPIIFGKTSLCVGESAIYKDSSSNKSIAGARFNYYFGSDSAIGNPVSYNFKKSGTIPLKLVVKDGLCSTTDSTSIFVSAKLTVKISANKTTLCNGESTVINSKITGTSGNSFLWSNGVKLDSITINKGGKYSLTVTSPVGCKGNDSIIISEINLTNKIQLGKKIYCEGETAIYKDTINKGTGLSYKYDVAGSVFNTSKINYSYNTSGRYSVTFEVKDKTGCKADTSFKVLVNKRPGIPTISTSNGKTSFCASQGLILSIPSTTYDILWNNGGTKDSLKIKKGGYYNVTLTTLDGCTDSANGVNITSNVDSFDVDFTASPKTITKTPLKCTFSNYTLNKNKYDYVWNFGDTSTSTDVDPIHTYKYNGVFNISLIAINKVTGCQDTMTKNGFISIAVAIFNNIKNTDIKIYPNPVTSYITVDNNRDFNIYSIIDLNGKVITKSTFNQSIINTEGLPSGDYILLLENLSNKNRYIYKFSKQ